jgi:hypothetical protein
MIAKLNSDGAAGRLSGREEFVKLLESLYPHDCKFVYILASHILSVRLHMYVNQAISTQICCKPWKQEDDGRSEGVRCVGIGGHWLALTSASVQPAQDIVEISQIVSNPKTSKCFFFSLTVGTPPLKMLKACSLFVPPLS